MTPQLQSINHKPSSSSLIPSNIPTGNEAREAPKDDDDDNDNLPPKLRPFNTRFTFFLTGVTIPSSSVSTLTTTLLRASSFSAVLLPMFARLSERFKRSSFFGGYGACA
jgi:hypothetical protein